MTHMAGWVGWVGWAGVESKLTVLTNKRFVTSRIETPKRTSPSKLPKDYQGLYALCRSDIHVSTYHVQAVDVHPV